MACLGKEKTFVGEDGWTVFMRDGSLPAHFEHTILITENGNEVLTKIKK
jgi:methionyl aminopeptidase